MATETVGLGGAETLILQLSEEMRRRGHTVIPIGPAEDDGWLNQQFLGQGFPWETYHLDRPIDFPAAERIAAQLRRIRADVIHGHEFVMGVYGAAAGRIAGVRHIMTMHGNQQMLQKLQRRVALKWAIGRSDATVAVSSATRDELVTRLRLAEQTVQVVRNGIPERPGDATKIRRELGLGQDELLVLAVGSLMLRKGHRVLLEAMTLIRQRHPSLRWQVVIAGEGEQRSALEQYIAENGLAGQARLLGNRNDVPDLQAAADVFAMPSLWEGLPLAILEAMFARTPLIATTASGIPEAVDDGEHGLLIPPADPEALASALLRLLQDPALRERLGEQARARAETAFSMMAMADAYEALYRG
ncbi:MAG: glycosyltransferase family 4 protein [Gemmatimonadaceae bacterium]|nr:glycosyltransferase family 4 protein [Gemmatimonadaceae bacterium]